MRQFRQVSCLYMHILHTNKSRNHSVAAGTLIITHLDVTCSFKQSRVQSANIRGLAFRQLEVDVLFPQHLQDKPVCSTHRIHSYAVNQIIQIILTHDNLGHV